MRHLDPIKREATVIDRPDELLTRRRLLDRECDPHLARGKVDVNLFNTGEIGKLPIDVVPSVGTRKPQDPEGGSALGRKRQSILGLRFGDLPIRRGRWQTLTAHDQQRRRGRGDKS